MKERNEGRRGKIRANDARGIKKAQRREGWKKKTISNGRAIGRGKERV